MRRLRGGGISVIMKSLKVRAAIVSVAVLMLCGFAAAAEPDALVGSLVSNQRWPRSTNAKTWAGDILRIEGLEAAPETAQGKAFFTWLRLYCRMAVGGMIQAHEGEYGRERYVVDAHKNLFVYGWGFCDTCSRIADAAWSELKNDALAAERVITQHKEGGFHTMYRLRMDGAYGAFDPRYGYYLIDHDAADARVLDWAEVGDDRNILRNKEYRHRSRPFFEIAGKEWERALEVEPAYFPNQSAWERAGSPHEHVFGDSFYELGTQFHDMNFRLPRGTTITRYWNNKGRVTYRPVSERANRELPFLPSGRFYRVTDSSHGGNWPQNDPNYAIAEPYLETVPTDEGYAPELAGGKSIGQAWGEIVYQPDLSDSSIKDALLPGATLTTSPSSPYLHPIDTRSGGSAVLDFYSPYVLVDGELSAKVEGPAAATTVEIRTLAAKPAAASETDVWSQWQVLPANASEINVSLGRPRFNGKDVSIHGIYRFQLRVSVKGSRSKVTGGLSDLRLRLAFENGIMALPRIFPGSNAMRFSVEDASKLRGPLTVSYRYATPEGEKTHEQVLKQSDFRENTAAYKIDSPGLTRCESVTIRY